MLPTLPEVTSSCSHATGQRAIVSSVIPENTNTCQTVEVLDRNYSSSEINQVQSSYSSVSDNREAKMMRSLLHGNVFNGNPVVEILIFIEVCNNSSIDCVIDNEERWLTYNQVHDNLT